MKNHNNFFKKTKSLPVDEFFQKVLYEKKIGYYNTIQPFGKDGDFITAPKISNLFSEMIAIWIISTWENFDKPKVFNIVELGPGDGSLMKVLINVFKKFFGGGNAELKFIDSDDPLEAGLEVFAQLPGKKLIEMSSLSGGEKGLVSLSLIFAVFLTNPSPICVLDEVDAALDDSNVEKFCDLVEEISSNVKTRFLVITHHPLTMARMDRLYGVTMQEKGVSQLVSVDLNIAEKIRNIA